MSNKPLKTIRTMRKQDIWKRDIEDDARLSKFINQFFNQHGEFTYTMLQDTYHLRNANLSRLKRGTANISDLAMFIRAVRKCLPKDEADACISQLQEILFDAVKRHLDEVCQEKR